MPFERIQVESSKATIQVMARLLFASTCGDDFHEDGRQVIDEALSAAYEIGQRDGRDTAGVLEEPPNV